MSRKLICQFLVLFFGMSSLLHAQGNRLSIQATGPSKLSICGVNDSAFLEVYNISSGTVNNLIIKLNLPPGIRYVKNSITGGSVSESNVSNTNQPEFSAPNLAIAKNFKCRLLLTADCDLLSYLSSNTPSIPVRINYTGNYDIGSSIPFSVRVPSAQFGTIVNLSYTGDIGTKFERQITVGNYGKGPLRQIILKRINGKDIQTFFVNKGSNTFKGDTVYTLLSGNQFKSVGNLDTFLDQNETITINDSSLIKGCRYLTTNYELSWGCNAKSCLISKSNGSVSISNKAPNLKALPFPVTPTCFNNNTFSSEVRYVNVGNMDAINPRVAISLNYAYVFSTFDTASVRIKVGYKGTWVRVAKDSVTGSYNLGYYGCIGVYPIGYFRLKAPNLKPNDTLYLKWNTNSCTAPPCSNASMVINSWAYYADYKDQCNNLKTVPWAWGKVYDQHYATASSFIPTDLINKQKGEFRTLFSSVSMFPRTSTASYVVDLILPKGLTHSKLKSELYFINADLTGTWSPDSIALKGDTLRGYFPHPVPISLTNSELVYYLTADCSKTGSNGFQTVKAQFRYSPDKACSPREWLMLSCQSLQVKVHCINSCAGGLKFRNFSVQRINFGRPDNNNDGKADLTGAIDTLKVREERCFFGDTIQAVYTGKILRSSAYTSWRNLYIESNITNGKNLDVVGVQLLVWRRGVTLSTNCSNIKRFKTISGNNATFKIDLSTDSMLACVSTSFRYNIDDSLIVKVKFRVSKNIANATQNLLFNNLFYTSPITNPTTSVNKFQCDTFSGQMILAGYYFAGCCSDNVQINSCNQITISNSYYMGIGACCSNYAGNNYFPYEYRHFARLKSVRFYLPNGIKLKKALFGQYRTSGSNKTTLEIKDSLLAKNNNANPLVYDVSKHYVDSGGKINFSDDAFQGYFQAFIEPSCELQTTANIPVKYDFIFERKNTLGNGYDTVFGATPDYINYNKPVTVIKPSIPTVYATQDTAEWELVYTNYSSSFSNINSWFSPDNTGAVKVVQIKDAAKDTLIPQTNAVYRLGTIPFNQTRKFKVRAIYNTCFKDSVILYTGWNCQGYPKDLASYNCFKERIALYIEPQNTQFQTTLLDSVKTSDLCANNPYTFLLENTGATPGYNTRAQINLPIGMSIVPGSCYMRYPFKGSKVNIPLPSLKSGTLYEWNLPALNTTIANGLKGVSDTSKNKVVIFFRVKTNCDYSSGNYIRASASGNIKCGDPILSYPSISNPLNIKGVVRPYYTLLKTSSDTIFPCEKPSNYSVKIINLGPSKTGIEDKYQMVLLPGMTYDSAQFQGIYNAPNNALTKKRNINGATEVEFSLPSDIQPGDSIEFKFKYSADGKQLNCGTADLYSQAAVKQEVTCVADNSKCKINVVTGNQLLKVPVLKSSLSFYGLSAQLQSIGSDSETIALQYFVKNTGSPLKSSKPVLVKYVYDQNSSGTADAKDKVAYADTLRLNLAKNGSQLITKTVRIKAGLSCALFVMIDSATCSCNFSFAKFPIPRLKNAGVAKSICSGDTVSLGLTQTNGFKYLWQPSLNLNNDTLAQTKFSLINTDTNVVFQSYVLTTYRGQCSSKDTTSVAVFWPPKLYLNLHDTSVCVNQKITFKAYSRDGTGFPRIKWTPGLNLNDSTGFTITAKALKNIVYKATITDMKKCTATDSIKIIVKPYPKSAFGFLSTCERDSIQVKDSSTVIGDSITYTRWTAPNLDTLNVHALGFKLSHPSTIPLQLVVKTNFGCADTSKKTVFVYPNPKADFSFKNVCLTDSLNALDASKILSGNIQQYQWQSSDGYNSNSKDFKHLYLTADTHTLQLIVKSSHNCFDTIQKSVQVYAKPKAQFSVNTACLGDSIFTNNTSSITADSIVYSRWQVNSDTSYTWNKHYLFSQDTVYNIQLKVATAFGCSDSIIQTTEVYTLPNANFTLPNVCEKQSSFCQDLSWINKGTLSTWHYTLSDGSQFSTPNFTHKFLLGDTFKVRLVVQSNHACYDTIDKITVVYPKLKPNFKLSNVCVSDSVRISDLTQSNGNTIQKWLYQFSITDSIKQQHPSYHYSLAGNYSIRQIVTSAFACVYDTSMPVEIYPLPKISLIDSNQCVDNQFKFRSAISISKGNILGQLWQFGDNTTSTLAHPFHTFPGSGFYTVKLIASSNFNCKDSVSKTIQSYPPVLVDFKFNNVCYGDPTLLFDQTLIPNATIAKYTWYFGDGDSAKIKDPWHTYQRPDSFKVRLKVLSSYNCEYDTVKMLHVYPVPNADFITDPSQGGTVVNPEIQIIDQSTGADTVRYNLGDGHSSNMRNLINSYPDSGTFIIQQFVANRYGCRDTVSKPIVIRYLFVFNAPTAFSPNDDGTNDVYAPGGIGYKQYAMTIFNRWGEIVYQTDSSQPWDGKYMNEPVMEGMYGVVFKVRDFKGRWHYSNTSFLLLR